MAEGSSEPPPGEETAGEGPSVEEVTRGLVSGQSKSKGEEFLQFGELENPKEGKNKLVLVCQHCRCKVIKPGFATLVDKEVS